MVRTDFNEKYERVWIIRNRSVKFNAMRTPNLWNYLLNLKHKFSRPEIYDRLRMASLGKLKIEAYSAGDYQKSGNFGWKIIRPIDRLKGPHRNDSSEQIFLGLIAPIPDIAQNHQSTDSQQFQFKLFFRVKFESLILSHCGFYWNQIFCAWSTARGIWVLFGIDISNAHLRRGRIWISDTWKNMIEL